LAKTKINTRGVYRILDANFNRIAEGLRVCEEVSRFILNDARLSLRLKVIRHSIQKKLKNIVAKSGNLIEARDTLGDVGRYISSGELSRKDYHDILFANIQRVKESLRVLEEFSKLISEKAALDFKKIRYEIYGIEKRIAAKIKALHHRR